MNINTMISDLIGFFNGFTRALCQDYSNYLGCEAIYNERCFLHLRKNNNDTILLLCRDHSGSYQYKQLKSMGQIIPKNRNVIEYDENEKKVEINNKNIINYIKFKKIEKKSIYFRIDNFKYDEKDESNEYYNKVNETINGINFSMMTNNLDLPTEKQVLFDENDEKDEYQEKNNDYGENTNVFDFINNINENNNKNSDIFFEDDDKNKRDKYLTKNSFVSRNDINNTDSIRNDEDFQERNKMQRIVSKNMEIIKNIDFDELNNDEIDEKDNIDKNENKKYSDYEKGIRNSLMDNFNQINNRYREQESPNDYEQMSNYNYLQQVFNNNENRNNIEYLRNNTVNNSTNINVINNNILNKANDNLMKRYISDNSINYLNQNNNKEINYFQNNANTYNNIYYPTQNNYSNYNGNNESQNSSNNNIYYPTNNYEANNNISPSSATFQPKINDSQYNNGINNVNKSYNNQSNFSEFDLSFLKGYSKSGNLSEDYLKIDPSNPSIISEIKEKMYFYHSLSNSDINKPFKISFKGYIGINIKPPNIINNKVFYLNIINENWKDRNYFTERNMNESIEQVTGMIYKIQLQKQKNAVKLMTYSLNQSIVCQMKKIDTIINFYNNILMYKFNYVQQIKNFVKRIKIKVEYKNNYMGWKNIKSDGNVIDSNGRESIIVYNGPINQGKILFENNNISMASYINKIIIMIQLKNVVISNMNAKINYSNSNNQSPETLFSNKLSLICFQYE